MSDQQDRDPIRSSTGLPLEALDREGVLSGSLRVEDFRIAADTLKQQATRAEEAGYRQVGENLRRAAELADVSNEELLDIYEALRPGRRSYQELLTLAQRLEEVLDAPRVAALVREAATVYAARGIAREGD
jgi:propanediol dehydratase small subunit